MMFDINNYKGKYAMHCKTREEADDFCNYLHNCGRKWRNGGSYDDCYNYFNRFTEDTVYYFNDGEYGHILSAQRQYYTILKWEDFMKHTFTKADLKNWDIIKYKNGEEAIVNIDFNSLISKDGWNSLKSIRDDLTNGINHDFDIVAVRRPKIDAHCQLDTFKYSRGTLIYERQDVEEMTLEQVCRLLGKEIKIIK